MQMYTYWIEKFLQYTGFKSADNLLDGTVPEIEDRVIAYLASMKERGRPVADGAPTFDDVLKTAAQKAASQ